MGEMVQIPEVVSKSGLLDLLEHIANLIVEDDSFGGTITYDALDPKLKPGEFHVTARFRHGNSQGQGFVRFVGELKERVDTIENPRLGE